MDYEIKGKFKTGHTWGNFTKKISSLNKKNAIEKTYSIIGSNHHLERRLIKIENILELEHKE